MPQHNQPRAYCCFHTDDALDAVAPNVYPQFQPKAGAVGITGINRVGPVGAFTVTLDRSVGQFPTVLLTCGFAADSSPIIIVLQGAAERLVRLLCFRRDNGALADPWYVGVAVFSDSPDGVEGNALPGTCWDESEGMFVPCP